MSHVLSLNVYVCNAYAYELCMKALVNTSFKAYIKCSIICRPHPQNTKLYLKMPKNLVAKAFRNVESK